MIRAIHTRYTFFIGCLISASIVINPDVGYAQTATANTSVADPNPLLGLVTALAWPVAALCIALAFRDPLTEFLKAVGSRVTKLSVFKVELELVPAKSGASTPLFDEIRTLASYAELSDSSKAMLAQIQISSPADYAVIDLGKGEEWLTSRLYIAAIMMERMRGLQAFVFVRRSAYVNRQFVALASVGRVRWALAQKYPWLEAAWIRACLLVIQGYGRMRPPQGAAPLPDPRIFDQTFITSDQGAFDPEKAIDVVWAFLEGIQEPAPVPGTEKKEHWTELRRSIRERAEYVTPELLRSLLPPTAFDAWSYRMRDAPQPRRTRAVLRRTGDFVALVENDREFIRLSSRRALLEEIAKSLSEELESA